MPLESGLASTNSDSVKAKPLRMLAWQGVGIEPCGVNLLLDSGAGCRNQSTARDIFMVGLGEAVMNERQVGRTLEAL